MHVPGCLSYNCMLFLALACRAGKTQRAAARARAEAEAQEAEAAQAAYLAQQATESHAQAEAQAQAQAAARGAEAAAQAAARDAEAASEVAAQVCHSVKTDDAGYHRHHGETAGRQRLADLLVHIEAMDIGQESTKSPLRLEKATRSQFPPTAADRLLLLLAGC